MAYGKPEATSGRVKRLEALIDRDVTGDIEREHPGDTLDLENEQPANEVALLDLAPTPGA